MQYLGVEYRLGQVEPSAYKHHATRAGLLKRDHTLEDTLLALTVNEKTGLVDHILTTGDLLQRTYGEGSGSYCLAVGVGIAALRDANSLASVPGVNPSEDWDRIILRQADLSSREDATTIEEEAVIGLLEILDVNSGYVEGYQATYANPKFLDYLGFISLGTLNAHDMMHFASTRA